ncbi:MAG: LysR substrate-binding domain-containing protein [Stappiaceae bacterium]
MNKTERLNVDSELLRTFLAVVRAGNVTHAAEGLGRTQSAISVQIRKLEEAVDTRLFQRQARGMALTEQGRLLVPAAQRAVTELDRIGVLFSAPLTGKVCVGIPDDYDIPMLERVLATFAKRHPQVEVYVRCGFSVGFPEAIRRRELDVALYTAPPHEDGGKRLFSEPTVWAAGKDFVLPQDEPVPLAMFDRECWWREASLAALDAAGCAYRIAYSSESVAGVKAAISAGLAVGALNKSTLSPTMRVLSSKDGFPTLSSSSLVLLQGDKPLSDTVQAMSQAIEEAVLPR